MKKDLVVSLVTMIIWGIFSYTVIATHNTPNTREINMLISKSIDCDYPIFNYSQPSVEIISNMSKEQVKYITSIFHRGNIQQQDIDSINSIILQAKIKINNYER